MSGLKLVLRFADGRVMKGTTNNFGSNIFHLVPHDNGPTGKAIPIDLTDLKAAFYVRDFDGNPGYTERKEFTADDHPHGRKVEITFNDGEVLAGAILDDNPSQPGFFLMPVDPNSNNQRIYVVRQHIAAISTL